MTAQVNDVFIYQDQEYAIAGISEGTLFDPAQLDLRPIAPNTACWRGYLAEFGILESHFVLQTLHVNLVGPPPAGGKGFTREVGPVINGVSPTGPEDDRDWFNNHYRALNYPLHYTGGVLIADGFLRKLYVHMGFHPAWKYETVIEFIFADGALMQTFDRSVRMAEVRARILAQRGKADRGQTPSEEELRAFVRRSFDRTYKMA